MTSVSTYALNIPDVERGNNRDHEALGQFNLGIFCDEETRMPIHYNWYNGRLTGRSNLSRVLLSAKDVGIQRVHIFMDGGFWNRECIQALAVDCETYRRIFHLSRLRI